MTRNYLFRNNRNSNKYIQVRRYEDGHYVWKQYIAHELATGGQQIVYTGCTIKNWAKGVWHRVSKRTMLEVTADYMLVDED